MRSRHATLTLCAVLMCAQQWPAIAAAEKSPEKWSFGYTITGDAPARPQQIFDDGERTYFQFSPKGPVPAVFDATSGQLLQLQPQGQLLAAKGASKRFSFRIGMQQAQAVGPGAAPVPVAPALAVAASGVTAPAGDPPNGPHNPTAGSYAKPLRGDDVRWVEPQIEREQVWFPEGAAKLDASALKRIGARAKMPNLDRVAVIARDDDSLKEAVPEARAAAIKEALIRAGVDARRISVEYGPNEREPRRVGKARWFASDLTFVALTDAPEPVSGSPGPDAQTTNAVAPILQGEAAPPVVATAEASATATVDASPAAGAAAAAGSVSSTLIPDRYPSSSAASTPTALTAPDGMTFAARLDDQTVEAMVRRWSTAVGYQLVWDVQRRYAIETEGDYGREYFSALDGVVEALTYTDQPIRFCIHANRVVRAIHHTSSCQTQIAKE